MKHKGSDQNQRVTDTGGEVQALPNDGLLLAGVFTVDDEHTTPTSFACVQGDSTFAYVIAHAENVASVSSRAPYRR